MTLCRHFARQALLLLGVILMGCASYRARPLDDRPLDVVLRVPPDPALRVLASSIKHPLLPPLNMNLDDGISAEEAAVLAVLLNPTLKAARDRRGLAAAQVIQAGILPNPQLSWGFDFPTGMSREDNFPGSSFGISWSLKEIFTKAHAVHAARADAAAVDLDIAWQEWQIAEGAKLNLIRLASLEEECRLAKERESDFNEVLDIVRKGEEIGVKTLLDLRVAEAAFQDAQTARMALERMRDGENSALHRSLGLSPTYALRIQNGISREETDTPPAAEELLAEIENRRLDFLALRKGYEAQSSRLHAAVNAQFPNIGIGYTRAQDTSKVRTKGFALTLDLPIFDRNQGMIAIEEATRQSLFDDYTRRRFETRAEIYRLCENGTDLRREIFAIERGLPALEELASKLRSAVVEGQTDILTARNAQNEWTAKRIELVEKKRDFAEAGIALEIESGRILEHASSANRRALEASK